MKILLNVFLLMSSFLLYGQESISYTITFCNSPQKIILSNNNGIIKGIIETNLTKDQKWGKSKEIIDKKEIDNILASHIMASLKINGIENLINCNDDEECKSIAFLDADYVSIDIMIDGTSKNFSYSEIYPESKSRELESIPLRRKVQILLTIIDSQIDVRKYYSELMKKLKKGTYCYWGGISRICIKNKK